MNLGELWAALDRHEDVSAKAKVKVDIDGVEVDLQDVVFSAPTRPSKLSPGVIIIRGRKS